MDIAQAYCKIGEPSNAKHYLDLIGSESDARGSLKYLSTQPYILEANGDYAGVLAAYEKYANTKDSIHLNIFSHDLAVAEQRHEAEKAALLKLHEKDRIITIALSIAIALLALVGYIYYRYRASRTKEILAEQEKKRLILEQRNLQQEKEKLELEHQQQQLVAENLLKTNENLRLERRQQKLIEENLLKTNENLQLERSRQSLVEENLRFRIGKLGRECDSLKEILKKQENLAKPIQEAIKVRIEMLNGMFATLITDDDKFKKDYEEWRYQIIEDKDKFMGSTRLAFKASHPKFIEYLEDHNLTEKEINYCCLYAIGLRGKEVGDYLNLRRHYHISSEIREKLGIDEHHTNLGIHIRKLLKGL